MSRYIILEKKLIFAKKLEYIFFPNIDYVQNEMWTNWNSILPLCHKEDKATNNKYKLYILGMLHHSSRHGHDQGRLELRNIPLITSRTSLSTRARTHTQTCTYTRTPTRKKKKKKLGSTNRCTKKANEQITVRLQQWATLTLWKGRKGGGKKMHMEIPAIVLDREGESRFLVKARRSWLSSTWHLARFKQPILQKAPELGTKKKKKKSLPSASFADSCLLI